MIIESTEDKREKILESFLLNMHLLTPSQRGVIVKIIDSLYGFTPIEAEYHKNGKLVIEEK